jgi:hypothetical protein
MATPRITARQWLIERGFHSEAGKIAEIEKEWRDAGKRTRRNWYEILAGDISGNPRVVAGRTFVVIAEIRARQKLECSAVAVSAGRGKRVPKPVAQNRWGGCLKKTHEHQ